MPVRLYLDVDGVVLYDELSSWGRNVQRTVELPAGPIVVKYAEEFLDALAGLAIATELVWLTTWNEDELIDVLDEAIGLQPGERLPVPLRDSAGRLPAGWKLEALLADQAKNPGPFVWVDDEAVDVPLLQEHLVLKPKDWLGVTPGHVEAIIEFAQQHQ